MDEQTHGKTTQKKFTPTQWIDSHDPEAIDEAREVALIDANGDYEQHGRIVCQSQKSLLSKSTEIATATIGQAIKPTLGGNVMMVREERERHPDVDIKKVHSSFALRLRHLLHPGFRRSVRSLTECRRAHRLLPAVVALAVWWTADLAAKARASTRRLSLPPAAKQRRRVQSRHFVQCLEFPCCYSGRVGSQHQAMIPPCKMHQ